MILTQMLMPSVEARHGRYSTVVISLTLVVTVIGGCRYCTARGQAIGDETTLTLASVVASLSNTSSMSVLMETDPYILHGPTLSPKPIEGSH